MKKILVLAVLLTTANATFAKTDLVCEAQVADKQCASEVVVNIDGANTIELANCLPPLKPLLPLKPLSRNGTWTQILINCQWVAVCIN